MSTVCATSDHIFKYMTPIDYYLIYLKIKFKQTLMGNQQIQGNVSMSQNVHPKIQGNDSIGRANHIKVTQSMFAYNIAPNNHRRLINTREAASVLKI